MSKLSFGTYDAIFEVVKDIVRHLDSVQLLVVESRVSILAAAWRHLVDVVRLVLQGVGNEDISAEIGRQVRTPFNFDVKVDRLPKKFRRFLD